MPRCKYCYDHSPLMVLDVAGLCEHCIMVMRAKIAVCRDAIEESIIRMRNAENPTWLLHEFDRVRTEAAFMVRWAEKAVIRSGSSPEGLLAVAVDVKLYRHNGHWWFTDGGGSDRIRGAIHVLYRKYAGHRVLPVTSKALADKFGVEIFNLIRNPSASIGIPFDKALREYLVHCEADGIAAKTVIQKRAQLLRFRLSANLGTLNQLTPKTIQDFLDKLPVTGQSKNRYLSTISRFCRYCKRVGYLGSLPTVDLERYAEVRNLRPRVLTRAEIDLFKAATDPVFAAVIELAYQTGMRLGEIRALWLNKWKAVDMEKGIALLEAGQVKNRRLKTVVLNQRAMSAIEGLQNNCAAPKRDSISRKWIRLSQRVGIKARFHDLRHTFATRLAQSAGRPQPKDISELLGHTTQSLANRIYYHPDIAYLRALVEDLPE